MRDTNALLLDKAPSDGGPGGGAVLGGVLWVLLGTFAFSFVTASGKLAGGDLPAIQIVFLRYSGGLVTVLLVALVRRSGRSAFASRRLPAHLVRALLGAGGVGCSLYAATHMPLAAAAAIGLTQGMFVVLLAAVFLKERVGAAHWLAVALCMAGALTVALGRAGGGYLTPAHVIPALVALAGAVLIAAELIMVKTLSATERPVAVLFYINLFGSLLLAVPAWLLWHPLSRNEALGLPLLGPLAIAAQYCNIRGFRLADAALLGPVGYSRLVFAGLIGLIAFGERPGPATWIGGGLIVAGGLMLAHLRVRPSAQRVQ